MGALAKAPEAELREVWTALGAHPEYELPRSTAIEAIFLLRAYRTTLPRLAYSLALDTNRMTIRRRISATFKDIPGGPARDEELVLLHSDNVQASGFTERLKLPHHVDFQAEIEQIRGMRAAQAARRLGLGIVLGAPNVVLGGSHSGNVSALELAKAGLLDALASDYVPVSLLHGAFLLHEQGGLPLPAALATVTANPARMTGFADRGRLAVGLRADLLRVRWRAGERPQAVEVWREGRRVA